jgi:tetratricopeptide (TPR) repeat protein
MLVYIVNTFYKNGKLKKSLEFADELHKSMKEFGNMLYDKYLFYYYNSLVINYSQLDGHKAIEILEELKENDKLKSNSFYQRFIYLNLFTVWFDLKDFHKAAKNLTKLFMLKDYKEADASLRFKIAVADLLTRYELNDTDTMEYKMKQAKKDFKELIQKPEHESEKKLMEILHLMGNPNSARQKLFTTKVKLFLKDEQEIPSEDSGLINYHNWLKEKTKV